jgi:hypothetical protein
MNKTIFDVNPHIVSSRQHSNERRGRDQYYFDKPEGSESPESASKRNRGTSVNSGTQFKNLLGESRNSSTGQFQVYGPVRSPDNNSESGQREELKYSLQQQENPLLNIDVTNELEDRSPQRHLNFVKEEQLQEECPAVSKGVMYNSFATDQQCREHLTGTNSLQAIPMRRLGRRETQRLSQATTNKGKSDIVSKNKEARPNTKSTLNRATIRVS